MAGVLSQGLAVPAAHCSAPAGFSDPPSSGMASVLAVRAPTPYHHYQPHQSRDLFFSSLCFFGAPLAGLARVAPPLSPPHLATWKRSRMGQVALFSLIPVASAAHWANPVPGSWRHSADLVCARGIPLVFFLMGARRLLFTSWRPATAVLGTVLTGGILGCTDRLYRLSSEGNVDAAHQWHLAMHAMVVITGCFYFTAIM